MTLRSTPRRRTRGYGFDHRRDGGRQLAPRLLHLRGETTVVLGLPRGGVPVADEVAKSLGAPLDVIIVRKLGVPWQPELAMGAIGEDGARVLNRRLIDGLGLSADELWGVEERERQELERRVRAYRGDRPMIDLVGKTAVIVDDGIATGSTAEAACAVARAHGASGVVLAVPVASPATVRALSSHADEVVTVITPGDLGAIGLYYDDFSPTSDAEVSNILRRAHSALDPPGASPARRVEIPLGDVTLPGLLTIPPSSVSIVVFAHGSGSSMDSPRNRHVASHLNETGHATLLFDLLTATEAVDRGNVFDIALLGRRLAATTRWVGREPGVEGSTVGYFGASTGAAAALAAASELGSEVGAVVSRGGRPDLVGSQLRAVTAPTLLIVGARDTDVLALNRQAASRMRCPHEIVVVAGASHLFEEPGTLDVVVDLASTWFERHLH